jgi:hypothetical protein
VWHCLPFSEGAQYGIELFYPHDFELHVSSKSVVANAIAPAWPNIFQSPCARSIAAAGLAHSIRSPAAMPPSAKSKGNAAKKVISAIGHRFAFQGQPNGHGSRIWIQTVAARWRRQVMTPNPLPGPQGGASGLIVHCAHVHRKFWFLGLSV